jgi:predicted flap endonuclease-1-like 5' DNA nuclease
MLKKMAKAIGLIGGAVAVLWAMRDRFVSVATSREPEPPTFRTPRADTGQSIEVIDGIGPVFATRLAEAGMEDIASLADASPDSVAEAAGVSGARARSWIEQAQQST